MPIYLASNLGSLSAQRNLNLSSSALNKSLERLSSGYKINRASDGAGSLLLSENLRSQIRGSDVAMSNVQQGLSMVQTADSSMQQIFNTLQSMREAAVAAANGTQTAAQYTAAQNTVQQMATSIDSIAGKTVYNGTQLLMGSPTVVIQAGSDNNANSQLTISPAFAGNKDSTGLGVNGILISSQATAQAAITTIDTAIASLSNSLATVGGWENTLSAQLNTLSIVKENLTSAEANIRNTDVAAETANVTRLQILQQAGAYALAQANAMPSIALKLLQ